MPQSSSMPRTRREIYLASRLDDMPYAEIAERTGLSVRQVEQHIARALLAIDDAIDGRVPVPWWRRWFGRLTGRRQ
jgi:DNA-directed RNA polymerase specialized sigma24 family protein